MILFLAGRLSLILFTVIIITYFSFIMTHWFPADTITALTGLTEVDSATKALLVEQYHFADSHLAQFWGYTCQLFVGNWGASITTSLPVFEQVIEKLPATIELVIYSMFVALVIGVPAGCLAGIKHHSKVDYIIISISLLFSSLPIFWLALIIVNGLSVDGGVFPTSGRISLLFDVPSITGFIFADIYFSELNNKQSIYANAFRHAVLPTLSLSLVTMAVVIKIARRSTIDVMNSDFIKATLARGLSPFRVIYQHGLKNIFFPVIPILTLQFTVLLTNTMLIEMVFDWPGIGTWLLNALYQRDYPVIRGGLVVMATLVMIIIICVDITLRLSDPIKDKDIHGAI
ncbi:MAG: ABC transporter permease subunit [Glaciecola sp.]